MNCIFCNIDPTRIVKENEKALAIFDIFPVNEGNMLIIPKKHYIDYFDVSREDREFLWDLIEECNQYLDDKYKPNGYNVGINCGVAAGQTVMHLHIHLSQGT